MRLFKTLMLMLAGIAIMGAGYVAAADSVKIEVDVDQLKEDGKAIGRHFAREGERIADEAEDFAERVADDFKDAWEDAKK